MIFAEAPTAVATPVVAVTELNGVVELMVLAAGMLEPVAVE